MTGDDLVRMRNGSETLLVHRTCVADHERMRWRVDESEHQDAAEAAPQVAPLAHPKRRGRPPKSQTAT